MPTLQRGFSPIISIVLLLIGLSAAIILVKQGPHWLPKAGGGNFTSIGFLNLKCDPADSTVNYPHNYIVINANPVASVNDGIWTLVKQIDSDETNFLSYSSVGSYQGTSVIEGLNSNLRGPVRTVKFIPGKEYVIQLWTGNYTENFNDIPTLKTLVKEQKFTPLNCQTTPSTSPPPQLSCQNTATNFITALNCGTNQSRIAVYQCSNGNTGLLGGFASCKPDSDFRQMADAACAAQIVCPSPTPTPTPVPAPSNLPSPTPTPAPDKYTVTIRAKGDLFNYQGPNMYLKIGGQIYKRWDSIGNLWYNYTVKVPNLALPVSVGFDNDVYYGAGKDINLYVDYIKIDNQTIQADDPLVKYRVGYSNNPLPGTKGLWWAGELDFSSAIQPATTPSPAPSSSPAPIVSYINLYRFDSSVPSNAFARIKLTLGSYNSDTYLANFIVSGDASNLLPNRTYKVWLCNSSGLDCSSAVNPVITSNQSGSFSFNNLNISIYNRPGSPVRYIKVTDLLSCYFLDKPCLQAGYQLDR